MTQSEARNAVRRIRRNYCELQEFVAKKLDPMPAEFLQLLETVAEDLEEFDKQLYLQKQPTPNCRPATQEELRALCSASNVVMFPAVA